MGNGRDAVQNDSDGVGAMARLPTLVLRTDLCTWIIRPAVTRGWDLLWQNEDGLVRSGNYKTPLAAVGDVSYGYTGFSEWDDLPDERREIVEELSSWRQVAKYP